MKSLEHLVEVFERSLRYLNVLKYLLNSKVFLQEISEQEELLYVLTKLLVSKSPFISLLAKKTERAQPNTAPTQTARPDSNPRRISTHPPTHTDESV